jgi:hypothetical protein
MDPRKAELLYDLKLVTKKLELEKESIIKKDFRRVINVKCFMEVSLPLGFNEENCYNRIFKKYIEHKDFTVRYNNLKTLMNMGAKIKKYDVKDELKDQFDNQVKTSLILYYQIKYENYFFFDLEYNFPNLENLTEYAIIFWILNVKIENKKKVVKHSNYFFNYIIKLQEMKEDGNIFKILTLILKKIYKHIKYGS